MIDPDFAVALGREAAEGLMRDGLLVQRDTGQVDRDPATLAEVPRLITVYRGPGRIQRTGALSSRDAQAAGFEYGVEPVIAQLPITATGVRRGDRVTVESVGPASDPDIVDIVATVRSTLAKSHPTKRTLMCEEVS